MFERVLRLIDKPVTSILMGFWICLKICLIVLVPLLFFSFIDKLTPSTNLLEYALVFVVTCLILLVFWGVGEIYRNRNNWKTD